MPAKNSLKQYLEDSYYHLYNRGVEKRSIFLEEQDYGVFLSYLKEYLLPKDEQQLRNKVLDLNIPAKERDKIAKLLRLNNFAEEITLIAYCLMPNHFHFFIKQRSPSSIDKFMQSLLTRYTMYFNAKYKRVGSLYQSVYKAVLIETDPQFLHLSRYIHKQALELNQPCSYPEYMKERQTAWIKPGDILQHFSKTNPSLSYQSFMGEEENPYIIEKVMIDDD